MSSLKLMELVDPCSTPTGLADVFPPEAPAAGASARAPTPPRIGVKIYEHDGDLDALFGTWRELGIDTAFASEALAGAPGFRAKAAERAVRLFLIAPVFYNPQALAEDPTLFAITAEGTPARQECRRRGINQQRGRYWSNQPSLHPELNIWAPSSNPEPVPNLFVCFLTLWQRPLKQHRTAGRLPPE